MESVIARILKDLLHRHCEERKRRSNLIHQPMIDYEIATLTSFARNDRGQVSDPEGGVTPSVRRGYAKLSYIKGL